MLNSFTCRGFSWTCWMPFPNTSLWKVFLNFRALEIQAPACALSSLSSNSDKKQQLWYTSHSSVVFSLFSHWNSNVGLRERWQNSTNSGILLSGCWGAVLHASLSECGHRESHNNRLSICWAEEFLSTTESAFSYCCLKKWRPEPRKCHHKLTCVMAELRLGTTVGLAKGLTWNQWKGGAQGWRPSLNVHHTHSGSCQLLSSSRKEIHKGNVLSYSSLFLIYWTNNDFTPASPCSTKGITGSSTWFLMTFYIIWYWIYMTSTIGKTCSWCSVVFPLTVTEHGGGLTLWFQMTTEGNCCLRRN